MYDRLGYVAWYVILVITNVSEDGESMFLRKVSNDPPDFMVIRQIMETSKRGDRTSVAGSETFSMMQHILSQDADTTKTRNRLAVRPV
jgi:hypothetical protein